MAEGDAAAARASFLNAVELAPGLADAQCQLALAHAKLGEFTPAQAAARAAIALDPNHAQAVHTLGALLVEYGRAEEAVPWLRRAVELGPKVAAVHRDLGATLLFLGDLEEAKASLRRAVDLDPRSDEALGALAGLQPMNDGSPEAEALFALMERVAGAPETFDSGVRGQALFALGRALETRGEPDRAFACLVEANALRRAAAPFDIDEAERRMETIAEVFDQARMAALSGGGDPSERPIFIVGMPRSGSTLVEQILAAHPEVLGAGENPILPELVDRTRGANDSLYPYWAEDLGRGDVRNVAQVYLSRAPRAEAGRRRVTDKWLENFQHLGLIHACLPNATIIHCQRDPRDSCFSSFALRFSQGQGYAYDLVELGRYWRAYDRLMAHWRAVLPPGRMLEIPYEGVVADLETWARRLVAHCGLPWNDACLRFYEAKRQVRSASFAQVRQPIYTGSIGRWRPFARHLGPLLETLGEPWSEVVA